MTFIGVPAMNGTQHGPEHVGSDGDQVLVLHFRTQRAGIERSDTDASLTGATFDGQLIEGVDSVKTVGCRHHLEGVLQWMDDAPESASPIRLLDD
jgi:hypothetical protein